MSRILFINFLKGYFIRLLVVLISLAGIIFLFDIIELSKAFVNSNVSIFFLIKMALMKNYKNLEKITPFIILISGILFFNKKNRSLEIIAAKASGISSFSLILPVLVVTLLFSLFNVFVFNSVGIYFLKKYQDIEAVKLKGERSLITISKSGIWLRKKIDNDAIIINALRISQNNKTLHDLNIFYTLQDGTFLRRIIADKGILKHDMLELYNLEILDKDLNLEKKKNLAIPIKITLSEIIESLSSPETISFWNLFEYIDIAKSSGLSTKKYLHYLFKWILSPIYLLSMIFLSYAFITKFHSKKGVNTSIFLTISIGFLLYFISNFVYALGLSGKLPTILSAVLPVIASNAISLYFLLQSEIE